MFPSFLVLDVLTARQLRWKGERVKMLNTGIYSRIVGTVFPAVQKNICSSVCNESFVSSKVSTILHCNGRIVKPTGKVLNYKAANWVDLSETQKKS